MGGDDDGWNWPWLLFLSRELLHFTEEEFWSCTPKKLYALIEQAQEFNKQKYGDGGDSSASGGRARSSGQPKEGYIDQLPGW